MMVIAILCVATCVIIIYYNVSRSSQQYFLRRFGLVCVSNHDEFDLLHLNFLIPLVLLVRLVL